MRGIACFGEGMKGGYAALSGSRLGKRCLFLVGPAQIHPKKFEKTYGKAVPPASA